MPDGSPKKIKSAPKQWFVLAGICVVVAAGVFGVWPSGDSSAEPSRVRINNTAVQVELADTPRERIQGLSGRQSLADNHGMLFIFPEPGTPNFHMKDMQFCIDIIWLDQHRTVVDITSTICPDTYPNTYSPQQPAQYVLEVPAGFSSGQNISVGDSARFDIE
jgi:uncharacterized membrane protein (UPF0127 family)